MTTPPPNWKRPVFYDLARISDAGDLTVNLAISEPRKNGIDYVPWIILWSSPTVQFGFSRVIPFDDCYWKYAEDVILTLLPSTNLQRGLAEPGRVVILDDGRGQRAGCRFTSTTSSAPESNRPASAFRSALLPRRRFGGLPSHWRHRFVE